MSSLRRGASMRRRYGRGLGALLAAMLLAGLLVAALDARPAPKLVLWAWDRREDLRFLPADARIEVAFLAGTIRLDGERVGHRPRLAPLVLSRSTPTFPVVRIEVRRDVAPSFGAAQRRAVLAAIASLVDLDGASALQIDFDAPVSARGFYGALLRDLRARLPRGARLSITALASWCLGDRWLSDLPVDEAVPMFFRMGRDEAVVRAWLAYDAGDLDAKCARSAGVALDEQAPALAGERTVYAFAARSWSRTDYERALALAEARR